VELMMAFEVLQLGAAITVNQITNIPLIHVSGPVLVPALGANPISSVGIPILFDTEFAFVVQQTAAGVFTLRGRGSDGTAPSAHDPLTFAYASIANDFGNPQPGTLVTIDPAEDLALTLGQDGTIVLVGANTIYNINKASAAALVVPAPLASDNGVSCVFTTLTAFAHVITGTGLFQDGTASAPKSTITFNGFKGSTVTLVAENGFWNVQANVGVTLS
jgi:hypothetical protein